MQYIVKADQNPSHIPVWVDFLIGMYTDSDVAIEAQSIVEYEYGVPCWIDLDLRGGCMTMKFLPHDMRLLIAASEAGMFEADVVPGGDGFWTVIIVGLRHSIIRSSPRRRHRITIVYDPTTGLWSAE